jgi:hypothetical protein
MNKKDKDILIDVTSGILSLIISFCLISFFGLKIGLTLLGFVVLVIGFVRYEASGIHPILKALFLVAPYCILLMGALNGVIHLFFVFIIAALGSLSGVYIRKFLWNR